MNSCLLELQQLIAAGQAESAIGQLLEWLHDCRGRHPEAAEELDTLHTQVVVLSGNLITAKRDYEASILKRDGYNQVIALTSRGLLRLINKSDEYLGFSAYLEELEEEAAWEKAINANSIEGYEDYFRRYPKGKYALETERLIAGLREEVKRRALAEKKRRDFFTKVSPLEMPGGAPLGKTRQEEPGSQEEFQAWWGQLSPAWQKAFLNEIGHFGDIGEKQIQRILGLRVLDVSGNPGITDLEPLRHMASLKTLKISNTAISDLSPLATVSALRTVDLQNTPVQSLKPLTQLNSLRTVLFSKGPVRDAPAFRIACPSCELIAK
ncbi:MAG: leucine-rich repeat domain-containing protein [Bacteroidota bacterium]